MTKLDIAFLN